MAQEMSFDVSWALFFICFASFSLFYPPSSSPAVLSFCLAWWQHCHCLTVLQWYLFPLHEQLLMVVGISMNIVYILNKKISSLVDKTKKKRKKKHAWDPNNMDIVWAPPVCLFPLFSLPDTLSSPLPLRAVAHSSGGLVVVTWWLSQCHGVGDEFTQRCINTC